jgi:hypothetical protein
MKSQIARWAGKWKEMRVSSYEVLSLMWEPCEEDESSYQQGVLMEEDQRCVLIIGGIQIFLPNSPAGANTSVAHEEIVQQESKKEAMEPNDFKANCVCDAGAIEEGQPTETVKEEEKEQILMSAPSRKRGEFR